MTTLDRKRIRLFADQATRTSDKMVDQFTGQTPELWRGNDVQFEIGIGNDDSLVTDISNIASLTLEVRPWTDRDGDPLMTKTVQYAAMNDSPDQAGWDGKDAADAHALVVFTAAETNLDLSDATEVNYWLVVAVVTNDSPGRNITLQASSLKVVEDGTGAGGTPQENGDLYYTKGDADARYVQKHEDQAFSQWANGRWYHYISDTGLWYPEVALIKDDVPILTLGDGVATP